MGPNHRFPLALTASEWQKAALFLVGTLRDSLTRLLGGRYPALAVAQVRAFREEATEDAGPASGLKHPEGRRKCPQWLLSTQCLLLHPPPPGLTSSTPTTQSGAPEGRPFDKATTLVVQDILQLTASMCLHISIKTRIVAVKHPRR